jgi:hypothetical protein
LSNWSAGDFDWHSFRGAFRVVKEHREPREFWLHEKNGTYSQRRADYAAEAPLIHVREVMDDD